MTGQETQQEQAQQQEQNKQQPSKDLIHFSHSHLSVDEAVNFVRADNCGAISTFIGTTRDHFDGKAVIKLEYESHVPMATKSLTRAIQNARNTWNDIERVSIIHKLGECPVGDISVIISVSSPHRETAIKAVGFLIEELKLSAPIWKKEVLEDGEAHWKSNKEDNNRKMNNTIASASATTVTNTHAI
ncbi:Molybdopterin biosynthesis MoaE [Ramicandelaber brevisporus]|nr:Molybdopterin biosynthesis MoaE [Ramicandelaber brevisporus]